LKAGALCSTSPWHTHCLYTSVYITDRTPAVQGAMNGHEPMESS
jgi:hypothetical protein